MLPADDLIDWLFSTYEWLLKSFGGFERLRQARLVLATEEFSMSMVATFAHELSHYLLLYAESDPPGGPEAEEYATDVGAVFLGFGVFVCNAAFEFEGFSAGLMEGWRVSRQGYLGEVELAYALAIFCCLLDIPYKEPKPFLDANPRTYLKKAMKHAAKRRIDDLDRLRRCSGTKE